MDIKMVDGRSVPQTPIFLFLVMNSLFFPSNEDRDYAFCFLHVHEGYRTSSYSHVDLPQGTPRKTGGRHKWLETVNLISKTVEPFHYEAQQCQWAFETTVCPSVLRPPCYDSATGLWQHLWVISTMSSETIPTTIWTGNLMGSYG